MEKALSVSSNKLFVMSIDLFLQKYNII